MKFLVDVSDDAVPTDLVEDCLENDLACHVTANTVVELPDVQDPYQYLYAEIDHAVALLREARPYLESFIGVASGMRLLLPDVDELLQHHPEENNANRT